MGKKAASIQKKKKATRQSNLQKAEKKKMQSRGEVGNNINKQ